MINELHIELHVEHRTPVDDLEPISVSPPEDLREAALKFVSVLNSFARRIESGLSDGDLKSVAVNFWGAAYGLGLSCCEGLSMTERSAQIGVQRATISKQARQFVESNDLPPSYYMKQETDAYIESRLAQLNSGNGSNGEEHP
jgi:hypothetical protein